MRRFLLRSVRHEEILNRFHRNRRIPPGASSLPLRSSGRSLHSLHHSEDGCASTSWKYLCTFNVPTRGFSTDSQDLLTVATVSQAKDEDNGVNPKPSSDSKDTEETKMIYREILNNWYRANFDVSLNDAFEATSVPPEQNSSSPTLMWTSKFTCPITKHQIKAKRLPGIDNFRYFESKKLANQAAAREAVKFFCPIEEDGGTPIGGMIVRKKLQFSYMKEHKMALTEDSFEILRINRSGKKGGNWWTANFICPVSKRVFVAGTIPHLEHVILDGDVVWYRRKNNAVLAACEKALSDKMLGATGVSEDEHEYNTAHPTMEPLKKWYRKQYDKEISDDDFVISKASWKGPGGIMWTSSFICPETVERYDSGSLLGIKPHVSESGVHWYTKKAVAKAAAALRAHDVLVWKLTGKTEPRYCIEDPSTTAACESSPEAENVQLGIQVGNQEHAVSNIGDSVDEALPCKSEGTLTDIKCVDDCATSDEDEEEFIVAFVPNQGLGSLDALTDVWGKPSPHEYSNRSGTPQWLSREKAIERARSWLTQQESISQNEDRSTLDVGKSNRKSVTKRLLSSLALSNRAFLEGKGTTGVENAARDILDFLWSSPVSAPDADCVALYIQCLEGGQIDVIKRAERIVEAMLHGATFDGQTMPRPNAAVFNSLIQRRAEFGMMTSMSELKKYAPVNKETFLSCLSAVAHSTGQGGYGFDSQYILDCIEEMKQRTEAGKELGIDVYNAPMRWGSNVFDSLRARPYSKQVPHDDVGKIFYKKHCDENTTESHKTIREAEAINNWFHSIEANAFGASVRPNSETYESVIQAWLRTGTVAGLENAENILEAQQHNIRPEVMESFLMASAFHGDLDRVMKWVNILRNDASVYGVDMNKIFLSSILVRITGGSIGSRRGAETEAILKECFACVSADESYLVDANLFALIIEAHYLDAKEQGSHISVEDEIISNIMKTLEQFDSLILNVLKRKNEQRHRQLSHLLELAPLVYSTVFSALRDIPREGKPSLLQCLGWFEKSLRRSGELMVLAEEDRLNEPITAHPSDGLKHNVGMVLHNGDCRSWSNYYDMVMSGLSEIYPMDVDSSNDLLRLMILVSNIGHRGSLVEAESATCYQDVLDDLKKLERFNSIYSQIQAELGDGLISSTDNRGHSSQTTSDRKKNVVRTGFERRSRQRDDKKARAPARRPRNISRDHRRTNLEA